MRALEENYISEKNDALRRGVLSKIGTDFAQLDGDADDHSVARELVEIGAVELKIQLKHRGSERVVVGSVPLYRRIT